MNPWDLIPRSIPRSSFPSYKSEERNAYKSSESEFKTAIFMIAAWSESSF